MITTPPFLLFAALLFWGWQTGYLLAGALLGFVLEASRRIEARWDFSQSDFDRLWNICTVLFLGAAIYLFFDEGTVSFNDFLVDAGRRPEALREKGRAALLLIQWFPLILFPFMAAQAFSASRDVDAATFSWLLRRWRRRENADGFSNLRINGSFVYFAICLFAASAANQRTPWFFAGMAVLLGWALWAQRARSYSAVLWALLLLLAIAGGYGGHVGLSRLQNVIEQANLPWFNRFAPLGFDGRQTRTFLGRIGRLKLSDRIVLRVRTDGQRPPGLLREASYNVFREALWLHQTRDTRGLLPEENPASWVLATNAGLVRQLTIGKFTSRAETLLAVPLGVLELHHLPVVLQRNAMGTLHVGGAPGVLEYDVTFASTSTVDSPPMESDYDRPTKEAAALRQVAEDIGLTYGMPAPEAMRRVAAFFQEHFRYARYLGRTHLATSNETALTRFLLTHRRGHCEYFATAAALLLREAGIPTRYAVGYAVQEGAGKKFVVRERHAHAWTLVYYENSWHDFDTTPGSWDAIEAQDASWLLPVKDFFSATWYQFSKWRWSSVEWRKYVIWAPAPLLVVALAGFVFKRQWRNGRKPGALTTRARPGEDSEFYLIENALARRGLDRRSAESWTAWLGRIRPQVAHAPTLDELVRLHQRYRFDPRGLTKKEREHLRAGARDFMARRKSSD